MTEFGRIYCITNAVNGKQYIGQTRQKLSERWWFHLRSVRAGSETLLHRAIRKHGAGIFTLEQIDLANSLAELNKKEAKYILEMGTIAPRGYNLTTGGEGVTFSKESLQGLVNSHLDHVVTEETRRKLSAANKKTHCRCGHLYDSVNTYVMSNGARRCWTCHYLRRGSRLPEWLLPYIDTCE